MLAWAARQLEYSPTACGTLGTFYKTFYSTCYPRVYVYSVAYSLATFVRSGSGIITPIFQNGRINDIQTLQQQGRIYQLFITDLRKCTLNTHAFYPRRLLSFSFIRKQGTFPPFSIFFTAKTWFVLVRNHLLDRQTFTHFPGNETIFFLPEQLRLSSSRGGSTGWPGRCPPRRGGS